MDQISPIIDDEAQAFLSRHARRNYCLYMLTILVSLTASSFGDMTAFVPSLAMRLHAPSWLVVFPMVAGLSIAYAPSLLVAWLLGPNTSRVRFYAASVAVMYLPILVFAVFLFRGGSDHLLRIVFVLAIVAYSLSMGVTILPAWDLFTRVFPDIERAKILAHGQVVGQVAVMISAPVAAWLISSKSPLPYPKNYAAAMLIFASDGLISAWVILMMKEYRPREVATYDPSLRAFIQSLRHILRTDRKFVATLKVAAMAYVTAAVFPLLLNFAQKSRGFSTAHDVPLLIGVKPFVTIPAALAFAYLARRIGPARVGGILALILVIAMPLALTLPGRWQFVPLMLTLVGAGVSVYAMLTVMRFGVPEFMHQYLALYFTACMIPGLAPLGLAWVMDRWPMLVFALVMGASGLAAIGFFFVDIGGARPIARGVEISQPHEAITS